jgi:hypothetical protein
MSAEIIAGIGIGVSLTAFGFSIYAFKRARPSEKRQLDSSAMLECFKILSNPEVKKAKYMLAKAWRIKHEKGEPAIFKGTGGLGEQAYKLEIAYNHASVLYEFELLNKEHFEKTYGGGLVLAWKIVKDDLEAKSKNAGKTICEEFQKVAQEFISKGIDPPIYDPDAPIEDQAVK